MFDLVVMDEASQIKPEHAIGALLRGRQAVIVGDPKQLPPTNFFDRVTDDDGGEEEETDAPVLHADDKIVAESVLDLAMRSFQPARRLRWHYRSEHESLIAFSNRQFYDNDLIVFPSASPPGATLGIEVVEVTGFWRNRTNAEEAQAVGRLASIFMKTHLELSHGIVAMNQPQRDLIQAELDVSTVSDPDARKYRENWEANQEPPFVKNLENVQGDERDVIFISLGWGRTPQGAMHQRFFPINRKEDGHRRLNVLFTRARKKIVIFASLRPEDIIVEPDKTARGVVVLRDYLLYARERKLAPGTSTERGADSPFESAVANALRARGHMVEPQVGVEGYFIDIGVRHPAKPAHFVVGIECDGATYHSAKSARDRDRLRQEALERLGWRLLRVWSTDWFRDHKSEADRLSAEINAIVKESDAFPIDQQSLVDIAAVLQRPAIELPSVEKAPTIQKEAVRDFFATPEPPSGAASTSNSAGDHRDLGAKLRQFRESVIMRELPGSEPDRCILRDEMIAVIVRERLSDPDDFTSVIPQRLRTRTDGRQMRYLDEICEIVAGG